ncbi:MAG: acetyltransferase [Syntrophorhabdaceae bacterium]|nr:acetyltransferase [Syntrophorhabdaceae bacterium]
MDDGIVVVGAGGHAKVVIGTAIECGLKVSFILDDNPTKWGKEIFSTEIKGPISKFSKEKYPAIMAIGDNRTRKRIVETLEQFQWITIIHPSSYVHPSSKIGVGTVVFAGSIIQPDVRIGEHCIINTGATVDHDCVIGNFVHIAPGVNIAGGVTIEDGVFMGIGSKVVIGKKIGEWSIVGAGGVVVEDIPPEVIAKGLPAKPTKKTKEKR